MAKLPGSDRTVVLDDGWNTYVDNGLYWSTIHGLGGNDFIRGGRGVDIILGGRGDDSLYGGDGNDILYTDNGPSTDVNPAATGNDLLDGGRGSDQFYIQGGTTASIATVYGGLGADRVYVEQDTNYTNIYGGDGGDWIFGSNRSGTILAVGEDGNDHIFLNQFQGTALDAVPMWRDVIYGGKGNDEIVADNDQVYGGRGDDRITLQTSLNSHADVMGGPGSDEFHIDGVHFNGLAVGPIENNAWVVLYDFDETDRLSIRMYQTEARDGPQAGVFGADLDTNADGFVSVADRDDGSSNLRITEQWGWMHIQVDQLEIFLPNRPISVDQIF